MLFEVQTRTHSGALRYWHRLNDAMVYAKSNEDVWKISFPVGHDERCRLIKKGDAWVYENMMEEIQEELAKLDFREK